MNKLQLTLLFILCQLVLTQITMKRKCDCSEYSVDVCASYYYCSWDGLKCVDLDCTLRSQKNCIPEDTMLQCQWDSEKNKCIYNPYTCSQIKEEYYCEFKSFHGLNCMWNKFTGCSDFSCKSAEKCPFSKCSYWQGVCDEPTSSIDCGSLSGDYCNASDGQGQFCALNDNNECSSYDAIVNCPQLADNQALCQNLKIFCVYENNSCRKITCEDYNTEYDCDLNLDPQSEEITPCFWNGSVCRTASDLDIENFSFSQCKIHTYYNYKWENSKCQACQQYSFDLKLGLIMLLQFLI